MKKIDSWQSEFRKVRFYENQQKAKEKESLKKPIHQQIPTTIAVMLDIEGTCDHIDDKKASLFVKQLELIRKKYKADRAIISMSTHAADSIKMKEPLDILNRNLSEKIEIGLNFFYGGIYDYQKDEELWEENSFNLDKAKTFTDYYCSNFVEKNQWFAIIDDGISEDTFKKYKDKQPMTVCRPSQSKTEDKNFTNLAVKTVGFAGVVELLDTYIELTKDLPYEKLLETQRNMLSHLSSYELNNHTKNRDYSFLLRYFNEGYADEDDYKDTLMWIDFTAFKQPCTEKEKSHLSEILNLMNDKFQQENQEEQLANIKILQKKIESQK